MNFNRAQLKEEVKNDIRQTRPRAILVTLVFQIVAGLISGLIGWVQQGVVPWGLSEELTHLSQLLTMGLITSEEALLELAAMGGELSRAMGIGMLFGLLGSLAGWTLSFGYQGYCLSMVRGENPGFGRLLCAFPQWGWVLLTGLLVALFTTLWALLFSLLATVVTVVAVIFLEDNVALAATLSIAAWVGVIFAMAAITLRYAMANYILLDEKTDALEAISRSKAMMRGRKWHLFVLYLSFIGWYLLLGLIVCVGGVIAALISGSAFPDDPMLFMAGTSMILIFVMWVVTLPLAMWIDLYVTGSEAKFYDWMRGADQARGVWESDRQYRAPYIPQNDSPRRGPQSPGDAPDRPNYE